MPREAIFVLNLDLYSARERLLGAEQAPRLAVHDGSPMAWMGGPEDVLRALLEALRAENRWMSPKEHWAATKVAESVKAGIEILRSLRQAPPYL